MLDWLAIWGVSQAVGILAYHMQAADKGLAGNLIRGEDLERILTSYLKSIEVSQARTVARLLIEQLRSRNFILCFLGADSYGFVHRTFLEYFCACEFVERFGKRGIEGGLSIEELKTEVFGKHWQDESWHEVLRLIVGMIDTSFAGEIIDYLIEQNGETKGFINIFLAAECFSEVRNGNTIAATATKLLNYLNKYNQSNYVFQLKLPEFRVNPEISGIKMYGINFVHFGASDFKIRVPSKHEPNTLLILKERAQSSNNPNIRCSTVRKIAQDWKDEPSIFEFLCERTVNDPFEREKDWDTNPRQTALEAIIKQYPDHPQTLTLCKDRAENDPDYKVREFAVRALANTWKDEPGMFAFLCDRALNDPFERKEDRENNPRQLALKIIIKQYRDRPQTLPLLQNRAENDPDEKVRAIAKKKLAELDQ